MLTPFVPKNITEEHEIREWIEEHEFFIDEVLEQVTKQVYLNSLDSDGSAEELVSEECDKVCAEGKGDTLSYGALDMFSCSKCCRENMDMIDSYGPPSDEEEEED